MMSTKSQTQAKATQTPTPLLTPARSRILLRGRAPADLVAKLIEPWRRPLVSQPLLIQAKLTINQPNDRYEQEADRVADVVMRMPEPRLQRQVEPEEEEEEELVQAKPLADRITPLVQRQVEPEEEPIRMQEIEEEEELSP